MLFFVYFLLFGHLACEILAPRPGTEPIPLAVEAWSVNHQTAREVPGKAYFYVCFPGGTRGEEPAC